MPGPGIPWAALACCWNTIAGPICPLCELPTILWGFGKPLDAPEYPLGGQRGMAETVCVACGSSSRATTLKAGSSHTSNR
jgi:hypothetical protein